MFLFLSYSFRRRAAKPPQFFREQSGHKANLHTHKQLDRMVCAERAAKLNQYTRRSAVPLTGFAVTTMGAGESYPPRPNQYFGIFEVGRQGHGRTGNSANPANFYSDKSRVTKFDPWGI